MKTKSITISTIFLSLMVGLFSCNKTSSKEMSYESSEVVENSRSDYESFEEAIQDSVSEEFGFAFDLRQDSIRKLKQHASLEIEVDSLEKSVLAIEKSVLANRGFILKSSQYAHGINWKTHTKNDSIAEIEEVRNHSEMLVRVPRKNVRNVLEVIRKEIKFRDKRDLQNEDLTFTFREEELAKRRAKTQGERLQSLQNQKAQLDDKIDLAQAQSEAEWMRDYTQLEIEKTEDGIAYATIEISLKGETEIRVRKKPNFKTIANQYKASFFEKAGRNIKRGWGYFLDFFLFLLEVWPFAILVSAFFLWALVLRKKKRN